MQGRGQPTNSVLLTTRDWSLATLVASGPRFRRVKRLSANLGPEELFRQVVESEDSGMPIVIEGWHERPEWPTKMFDLDGLKQQHGSQVVEARNIHGERLDKKMPLSELVDFARAAPPFVTDGEQERFYGKDMECPAEWKDWLRARFSFNNVSPHGQADILDESVQTLMCYLGISDTFTPCHKDLCGSTGQNMMCYTENDGSAFWFMTKSSAAPDVAEYFHSIGHELDWETHAVSVAEFADAPFDVYITEQKLGDLVIVPPRSCHQVVNHGGVTVKTSWSRMTIRGLEIALYHELPIYRRVSRPEVYRVKFTIHSTMLQRKKALLNELRRLPDTSLLNAEAKAAIQGLSMVSSKLLNLFDEVLFQEYTRNHLNIPVLPCTASAEHRTCDFCGADIFQSFFSCNSCVSDANEAQQESASDDGIHVCAGCYVEGRTCKCGSMQPVLCRPFLDLLQDRNSTADAIHQAYTIAATRSDAETVEEIFYRTGDSALFDAACCLYRSVETYNAQGKDTRACTNRSNRMNPSHPIPYSASLNCRGCHASKCFEHILETSVHSATAILSVDSDATHEIWHQHHKGSKAKYKSTLPGLLKAIRAGTSWDLGDRLVHAATHYPIARPLSENTKMGFYDRRLRMFSAGQKAVNGSEVDASEIASTLSQLNPVNRGKNLRKEILDCVLISRVSSSSKRQRRTTMEGSNKRAKINASSASASTSQLADPLFIPSNSASDSDTDIKNESSPSRGLYKPSSARLPPSSGSSSDDPLSISQATVNISRRPPGAGTSSKSKRPKPGPDFKAAAMAEKQSISPIVSQKQLISLPSRKSLPNLDTTSRADATRAVERPRDPRRPVPPTPRPVPPTPVPGTSHPDTDAIWRQDVNQRMLLMQDHLLKTTRENADLRNQLKRTQNELQQSILQNQKRTEKYDDPEFVGRSLGRSQWWNDKVKRQSTEIQAFVQQLMKKEREQNQIFIRDRTAKGIREGLEAWEASHSQIPMSSGALVPVKKVVAHDAAFSTQFTAPPRDEPFTSAYNEHGSSSSEFYPSYQNEPTIPMERISARIEHYESKDLRGHVPASQIHRPDNGQWTEVRGSQLHPDRRPLIRNVGYPQVNNHRSTSQVQPQAGPSSAANRIETSANRWGRPEADSMGYPELHPRADQKQHRDRVERPSQDPRVRRSLLERIQPDALHDPQNHLQADQPSFQFPLSDHEMDDQPSGSQWHPPTRW